MVRKLESSITPDNIICSKHVLLGREVILPALVEDCQSLWTRVNRICDRYMPQLFDVQLGPQMLRRPCENTQK